MKTVTSSQIRTHWLLSARLLLAALLVGLGLFTTPAPTVAVAHPQLTPAPAWSALPQNGLNGAVKALAVKGSQLFVGGSFTTSQTSQSLNRFAYLNGSSWVQTNGGSGVSDESARKVRLSPRR